MDQDVIDNFFVTLPSNSSFSFFPNNTQSSFHTKLSSPLVLNGNWEMGLSEVFLPRNWFNVNKGNCAYSIGYESEELVTMKELEYHVQFDYEKETTNRSEFCEIVNNAIKREMGDDSDAVVFSVGSNETSVNVRVKEGYELTIKKGARKLMYMLRLPIEDVVLTGSSTYKYRPSTLAPISLSFTITNKNPKEVNEHLVPLTSIKENMDMQTITDMVNILHSNLKWLELKHVVNFKYIPSKRELTVVVAENAEILISKDICQSFMNVLGLQNDTIIRNIHKFTVDPMKSVRQGELMKLHIFEYHQKQVIETRHEDLSISIGMYKTPQEYVLRCLMLLSMCV